MKHFLATLVALALASPFAAPRDAARAPGSAIASIRPGAEGRESTRLDDARATEVVARDSRAPHRSARPVAHSSVPEAAATARLAIATHARTTGLAGRPHVVRALAVPFDATAPPVGPRR